MVERINSAHELILQWHRGDTTVPLEGFQTWSLAWLKPHLRYDRALWGLGAGIGPDGAQPSDHFSAGEAQEFEMLAPHMMQAYATRR